jgi:alpha-beta hydrolase superfamily lysophospholipase
MIVLQPLFVQGLAHAVRPERDYIDTPSKHGLTFEAVNFRTSDGALLSGWFFPASGDSARGTVVISGTDAGNRSYLISYAAFYVDNRFNAVLYDYRGFGTSQEFSSVPDALIYPEYLADLNAAIDFSKSRSTSPVILFGLSMGSAISVGVAAQRQDVAAVLVDGIYSTTTDAIATIRHQVHKEASLPAGYPQSAEPVRAVASFTDTALLILAGEDDKVTTPAMACEVFSRCSSRTKSLWIAPNAVHLRIHEVVGDLYALQIRSFLDIVLAR